MEASSERDTSANADVQKAVRMAIAATEKRDYGTALTLFNHVYGNPDFNAPTEGLSYWGLCVAVAEKQTKKGVELCRQAMEKQFYDSTHHANLIRLHLTRGNRKLAVHAMEEAMHSLPDDQRLAQLRLEMGFRQHNPVPFLPRNSSLNHWLGKRKRGTGTRVRASGGREFAAATFELRNLQPLQMILFGFLGFATVFTITFYILYQRAYG